MKQVAGLAQALHDQVVRVPYAAAAQPVGHECCVLRIRKYRVERLAGPPDFHQQLRRHRIDRVSTYDGNDPIISTLPAFNEGDGFVQGVLTVLGIG